MLNKAPIFVNGFKYGGTNLIMNLLASHPDVAILSSETQFVFNSRKHKPGRCIRKLFYLPVQLSSGKYVFHRTKDVDTRRHLAPYMIPYVDMFFFADKMVTGRKEFKSRNVSYTFQELKECRFLAKNVNGMVLASDIFSNMYPDATFLALVRNGLALCEGFMRRGWTAEAVGRMYAIVCERMLHDAETMQNYHLVRFEEMVTDPIGFMKKIYAYAGLDATKVDAVRIQAKRSMSSSGTRSYTFGGARDRETHWFSIEELGKNVRNDVNTNQIQRLSAEDRERFLAQAGNAMKKMGYL